MLWILFLVFVAIGKSERTIDGTDLLSLIVFSWFAFTARRNFGPFAMISAPIISRHIHDITENYKAKGKKKNLFSSRGGNPSVLTRNWINLAIILLLVFAAGWKVVDVSKTSFVLEKESEIFPSKIVEILRNSDNPGRIFNEYNWGGYLIWHLRDYRVFVDGRTDLYGDEIIGEWSDIINALPGWEYKLENWDIDYLLVSSDWPLLLVLDGEWEIIYSDGIFQLARSPID
jgi:hypothetical protein